MSGENRPLLFITYSFDDPDEASVLDVSATLAATRAHASRGATYRLKRIARGTYGHEEFVEVRGGCRRREVA